MDVTDPDHLPVNVVPTEEGFELVTPVKPAAGLEGAAEPSPMAPGAPARPSSRASRRSTSPMDALLAAAPKVPELTVQLQYDRVPMNRSIKMKALVTAKPPPPAPGTKKKVAVVLALDASMSMQGASMDLLKECCAKLFSNPPANVAMYLRVVLFGTHLDDKKVGSDEMVLLDAQSAPEFLKIAESMKADQAGTNIGDAVLMGVDTIFKFRRLQELSDDDGNPLVGHVICLTDGAANHGITSGDMLASQVRGKDAPEMNIFTHYIGLGASVKADFMEGATAKGEHGVLSLAPTGTQLMHAFEEIFGLALDCSYSLNVRLVDQAGGNVINEDDVEAGMLTKERSVLIDVSFNASDSAGPKSVGSVQMLNFGELVGLAVPLAVEYAAQDAYGDENPAVKAFMAKEKVQTRVADIMRNAGTAENASQQVDAYLNEVEEDDDAPDTNTMRSLRGVSMELAQPLYRGLGAAGGGLVAARFASQAAHT